MKSLNELLSEYEESHQQPTNVRLHTLCVPLITWSLFGFVHTFTIAEGVRLSYVLALPTFLLYLIFRNVRVLAVVLVSIALCLLTYDWIPHLRTLTIYAFILGWIGQFYGHKLEGKKPAFAQDLVFLFIGPLWVAKKILPKLF